MTGIMLSRVRILSLGRAVLLTRKEGVRRGIEFRTALEEVELQYEDVAKEYAAQLLN